MILRDDLDFFGNFGKATVSIGYNAAAVSIALTAGQGVKLANFGNGDVGAGMLVWWNSTDYPDPSDDPNVEIVQCTNRSTDTLTIVRGQEGTAASTKNTAGKTYKVINAWTNKPIQSVQDYPSIFNKAFTAVETIVFDTPGNFNWTPSFSDTDGPVFAVVEIVGGGGGGGQGVGSANVTTGGGGGGSSGYSRKTFQLDVTGATGFPVAITVGAAGTGSTGSGGGDGGNTTFDTITATGGEGGADGTVGGDPGSGGSAGSASGGDVDVEGSYGGYGWASGVIAGWGIVGFGGIGAGSFFGGGPGQVVGTGSGNVTGRTASPYGAGGGGGIGTGVDGTGNGGDGAGGLVIITLFSAGT